MESVRLAPLSRQLPSVSIAIATTHPRGLIEDNLPATRASVEYAAMLRQGTYLCCCTAGVELREQLNATRGLNGIHNRGSSRE